MAFVPAAPAAVDLGAIGLSFVLLCTAIFLFAMTKASHYLVDLVFFVVNHTVGKIPLVGGVVRKITDPVYAAAERGFADAAIGLQGAIGFYWHGLATIVTWTAREIERHAHLLEQLALYALPMTWGDLIIREIGAAHRAISSVQHAAAAALERIHNIEATFAERAQAALLPRIHGLEHAIGHVIYPDLAGLRARTKAILDRLDLYWHEIRKLDALLGTAALTGAVAVALTQLDLNWVRCRNWKRVGRSVCGLPYELLDALLGATLDVIEISHLCEIIAIEAATFKVFEPALVEFVGVADALIGCHGASKPGSFATSTTALPPVGTALALA